VYGHIVRNYKDRGTRQDGAGRAAREKVSRRTETHLLKPDFTSVAVCRFVDWSIGHFGAESTRIRGAGAPIGMGKGADDGVWSVAGVQGT
jgi:hypothetical protein